MALVRRFVLASSLARLLQREGGPADRLVEAHFPARSDRTQLVRVERGRASLILRSAGPDGQESEEAVEVPLSHAEALVEVASGTVAFDRTTLALGTRVAAVLDRFIMPQVRTARLDQRLQHRPRRIRQHRISAAPTRGQRA